MRDSACKYLIVENAHGYVKNVLIFPRESNCKS